MKDVLQPFKVATQALSTEDYPTASAVLPLQYVLLTQLKPSTEVPAGLRQMKTMLSTDLKARYGPNKDAFLLLNTASYLDPRFHRLVRLEQESRQAVRDKVQRELADLREETGVEGQEENATTTAPSSARKRMLLVRWGTSLAMFTAKIRPEQVIIMIFNKK